MSLPNALPLRKLPGSYTMELDTTTGAVVFARKNRVRAYDFRRLNDEAMSVYDIGYRTYLGQRFGATLGAGMNFRGGEFIILNNDYDVIQRLGSYLDNSLGVDQHSFVVMPNGNYAYFEHVVEEATDIETECENRCLVVTQTIIEVTPAGELVNTVPLSDLYTIDDLYGAGETAAYVGQLDDGFIVDLTHINSLFGTPENDYLVSVRGFSEVVLIDRDTGEARWRLGGRHAPLTEFEILEDPLDGFSYQHSAELLENGNVLLFDNGNQNEMPVSRVVEYALDLDAMTATLVWSHVREDEMYTPTQGSVVRLPGGNTLVNWVTTAPQIQEVTPDGEPVLSISLPEGHRTYRANFWPGGA